MIKKSFCVFAAALLAISCNTSKKAARANANNRLAKADTAILAPPDTIVLKTMNDSASYAVGISVANFYKQMGIKELNTDLVTLALKEILAGKQPLMDDATANTFMNSYINKLQAEKAEPRILEGEKFLALNKTKPGVFTTPSGLQYEILTAGNGPKAGSPLDTVVCHYRGTFLDGAGFDNSYDRNEPTTFQLNEVIRGWTEGLQLMPVGSKYRFWVSHTLGYGANDYMAIPGGSTLVFEIELLEVRKKK